jgi:uncharacterized protein with NRDE domain
MCLILLAHHVHSDYPLVLAANRDEFYARPTAPAAFWEDAPHVLAGRDLEAGGSWLGVTRSGRWAALTNYRDPPTARPGRPSRGALVGDFLSGDATPADYLAGVAADAERYDGFNLLVGDLTDALYFGNRMPGDAAPRRLEPGLYGLSNHLLDTAWPKVERGRRLLGELLDAGAPTPEALFEILYDTEIAPLHALPDTGVDAHWERVLSASFITTPTYGTRASTALIVERAPTATFVERARSERARNAIVERARKASFVERTRNATFVDRTRSERARNAIVERARKASFVERTRNATVERTPSAIFVERTFLPGPVLDGEVRYELVLATS